MDADDRLDTDDLVSGSTAPADLGSTDLEMGLTAGGTGTQVGGGEPIGGTEARDMEDRGFDSSLSGTLDPDATDISDVGGGEPTDDWDIGPETGNTVYRME